MPKILIIGATSYAVSLRKTEISGSVTDSAAYLALTESAHMDVVVDCSGANMESKGVLDDLDKADQERLAAYQKAGVKGPRLGFVYTTGIWVHGSSHDRTSDLEPVGNALAKTRPPRMVAWRPQLEQAILTASDVLDAVVVRPSLVYGREHAIWTSVFGPILDTARADKTDAVRLPLDPHGLSGLNHADDVGAGIHAVVDKLPLLSGTGVYPVFGLVGSKEIMRDVVEAAPRVFGFKGTVELVGAGDSVLGEALGTSFNVDVARARHLLGWTAKRLGFVPNMDVYASAFAAAYGK